jgi:hypothetical protein
MFNSIGRTGAVGAGAASCYGSGSGTDQMMRLRLRKTFDCLIYLNFTISYKKTIHVPFSLSMPLTACEPTFPCMDIFSDVLAIRIGDLYFTIPEI